MAKVRRPYIPLSVRVAIAERQYCEGYGVDLSSFPRREKQPLRDRLEQLLVVLFGDAWEKVELHHRPALVNRPIRWVCNKADFCQCIVAWATVSDTCVFARPEYVPPANDPEHLVYVRKEDHEIETRVRGLGAQRSDLGQRRYLKKVAKNRARRGEPDTSDIPEAGEEWFKKARLVLPKSTRKRPKRTSVFRPKVRTAKRKWPKRKLRSKPINASWRRRRWPKRKVPARPSGKAAGRTGGPSAPRRDLS